MLLGLVAAWIASIVRMARVWRAPVLVASRRRYDRRFAA